MRKPPQQYNPDIINSLPQLSTKAAASNVDDAQPQGSGRTERTRKPPQQYNPDIINSLPQLSTKAAEKAACRPAPSTSSTKAFAKAPAKSLAKAVAKPPAKPPTKQTTKPVPACDLLGPRSDEGTVLLGKRPSALRNSDGGPIGVPIGVRCTSGATELHGAPMQPHM